MPLSARQLRTHPSTCLTSAGPEAAADSPPVSYPGSLPTRRLIGAGSGRYFLGQFLLTQTVTAARTAGLPGLDVGMVPAFKAFPASSITLAYTSAALLMAPGA